MGIFDSLPNIKEGTKDPIGSVNIDWKHKLNQGKYKGNTLEEVLGIDPKYLDWVAAGSIPLISTFLRTKQKEINKAIASVESMYNEIDTLPDEH